MVANDFQEYYITWLMFINRVEMQDIQRQNLKRVHEP